MHKIILMGVFSISDSPKVKSLFPDDDLRLKVTDKSLEMLSSLS